MTTPSEVALPLFLSSIRAERAASAHPWRGRQVMDYGRWKHSASLVTERRDDTEHRDTFDFSTTEAVNDALRTLVSEGGDFEIVIRRKAFDASVCAPPIVNVCRGAR